MNGVEIPDYSIYLQILSFVAGALMVSAYNKIKEFLAAPSHREVTEKVLVTMKNDLNRRMARNNYVPKTQPKCGWSILTGKPKWDCHCTKYGKSTPCDPPVGNDAATQRLREGMTMTDAPVHPITNRRAAIEHSRKK